MLRVPSVAKTEQTARPLSAVDDKLEVPGRSCTHCGSIEIRPSNRRNAMDILLACVFLVPFRCRTCRKRFYRMWRPILQQSPDLPSPPVLVMPALRTVPKLDPTSPRRGVIASEPITSPAAAPEPSQPLLDAAPDPGLSVSATLGTATLDPTALGAILILESDLSIRKLFRRLLERRGYFIVELEQADELASQLRQRRVALLIMGASPTGETTVKALAALARAHSGLKILALCAESVACAERDDEIPSSLFVFPKPFPLDSFVDCVDRLLQRSNQPPTTL